MKPKMIYFDYGNTLVYEKVKTGIESFLRVYNSIENKEKISIEELFEIFKDEKIDFHRRHHKSDIEYKYTDLFKFLFEKLGLETKISYEEISKIYFDDFAPGFPMKGAKELLKYLKEENIEVGIISNLSWSGEILRKRILEVLGEEIKIVITSGDWVFRKPDKKIFELAISLSGFSEKEIWYVGDNPLCDIIGAKNSKITPIYFLPKTENIFMKDHENIEIDFQCEKINSLIEIKKLIKERE